MEAGIVFSNSNWAWLAVALLLPALLLLLWSYRAAPSALVRWSCLALKCLGFGALAVCLLEPLWSGARARPGANLFLLLADNSQSLRIKDRGSEQTRGEVLNGLFAPKHSQWQQDLESNFEVRRYYFDTRLQSAQELAGLKFDGRSSALGASLRTVAERYRGRPLAGVLLFTDGNATDLKSPGELAGLPPIYPVLVGKDGPVRDVALQQVRANETDFEDAPVTLQADVKATGYRGESLVAEVSDAQGKKIAEQVLKGGKDNETLAFRFQLRPEQPGLAFYRLDVRARDDAGPGAAATSTARKMPAAHETTSEATLANNSTIVPIHRRRGPYRILYVAGRPNWEFKFMNRALQEEPELQLVALLRVAKREPKFNFIGRAGETSNPLFRGFGNQSAEDIERYDQPVLVRLNTRDELELRGGFPRTPEELYGYHAVIVDDLEGEFFTAEQSALLQKFVSERGGGFLMLGGMECFQQGRYERSPIGDMLPVYLDRVEPGRGAGPVRLDLTREGWLQPWARLRDNEADEKARLLRMEPFQVLNRVSEIKPGASILASATSADGQKYPALVVQRFGRGHTAALTIGDFWRWGFHDADAHRDLDKAWRQLMHWLVNDVPNPVELAAESDTSAEGHQGATVLRVRVKDPKFQPLDNAAVHVRVESIMSAGGGSETNLLGLRAEPSSQEPGLYEARFVPRVSGGYRATALVTNSAGVQVGKAEAGWAVDFAAAEFNSVSPNVSLLESLARATGGELVPAENLGKFAAQAVRRSAPVMEPCTFPLWHTPAMFAFALACLLSEWGLRRWKGMP